MRDLVLIFIIIIMTTLVFIKVNNRFYQAKMDGLANKVLNCSNPKIYQDSIITREYDITRFEVKIEGIKGAYTEGNNVRTVTLHNRYLYTDFSSLAIDCSNSEFFRKVK